jgi:hypothetical protein
MHAVIRNHTNTFNFILDQLEDSGNEENKDDKRVALKKNSVDLSEGKSLVHYIVNPLPFGSFENEKILRRALELGFSASLLDKTGRTPYDYACLQQSGTLKALFEELLSKEELSKPLPS